MTIVNGELHHCSVSGAFQRCVSPEEGCEILREIHEGDCGHHAGSKSLVAKAFRHGFYWLTAHADAEDLVKRCDGCQKFSRRAHVPAQELRMIPITWPFATWGLDMVGPFKRSKDKKTHLLVAVDKFTKWVEAEPVSKCDAATAVQFIKKVIFRFGFPHSIITDNGTNLSKGAMKEFCEREHIRLDVSSVAHPSPMDRQNELIRKSCEASNPGLWSHCKEHQDVGLKSYHLYYGVSILRQTGPQDTRHFSWSMEQRQFSLVTSGTIRLVWQLMLKQTMRQHGKTLWTYWTRSVI